MKHILKAFLVIAAWIWLIIDFIVRWVRVFFLRWGGCVRLKHCTWTWIRTHLEGGSRHRWIDSSFAILALESSWPFASANKINFYHDCPIFSWYSVFHLGMSEYAAGSMGSKWPSLLSFLCRLSDLARSTFSKSRAFGFFNGFEIGMSRLNDSWKTKEWLIFSRFVTGEMTTYL